MILHSVSLLCNPRCLVFYTWFDSYHHLSTWFYAKAICYHCPDSRSLARQRNPSPQMAKSKQRKRGGKAKPLLHQTVNLTEEQYIDRLLVLLEAREAHYDSQNAFFDLGGGERQHLVKAEFDFVARQEKIPVLVHSVKGKRTLVFVFPPGSRPKPQVVVRGKNGERK